MSKRRNHDAAFKAGVALETLKGEKIAAELATAYGVQARRARPLRRQSPEQNHAWLGARPNHDTSARKV